MRRQPRDLGRPGLGGLGSWSATKNRKIFWVLVCIRSSHDYTMVFKVVRCLTFPPSFPRFINKHTLLKMTRKSGLILVHIFLLVTCHTDVFSPISTFFYITCSGCLHVLCWFGGWKVVLEEFLPRLVLLELLVYFFFFKKNNKEVSLPLIWGNPKVKSVTFHFHVS